MTECDMRDWWETLGCTSATSNEYRIEMRLSKSKYDFRLDITVYLHGEKISKDDKKFTREIKQNMEYVGEPSLLARLLGRAEKQPTGTNAEKFVEEIIDDIVSYLHRVEEHGLIEVSEGMDREELKRQILPVSSWADVENVSVEESQYSIPRRYRYSSF